MKRSRKADRFGLALVILMVASVLIPPVFATITGEKEPVLTTEEKSVLFTPEGYYRAPPPIPGEVSENLSLWQLPDYEKQLSEGKKILSTTFASGDIELVNGWNFISFPKRLNPSFGHDQAASVFAGLNTGGHSIFTYNGATGHWVALEASTVIKPLVGYNVYSVGTFTLNPDYLPPAQQTNPSTTVYSGWNLIGYFDPMGNYADDYLHAAMARDEMVPYGADWCEIIGWNAATQQYETSIIKGSDNNIHSEYRLVEPKKSYWLWMNANRSVTYSVSHTYYCSAEWVSDYHGQQPTLTLSDDEAIGFYEELSSAPNWQGKFIIGDDTGLSQEIHWKESIDSNYIDNSHFAYFAGHGAPDRIVFYHPSDQNKRNLYYNEAEWGNGQVDWIALAACNVLNQSSYQNWQSAFKGLHSIVGWDTPGMCHPDLGGRFSYYMKAGNSIWESWRMAANDVIWEQNTYKVAILAADTDKDTTTRECIDDHIYGKGIWFSPPGYDLVFKYDTQLCV